MSRPLKIEQPDGAKKRRGPERRRSEADRDLERRMLAALRIGADLRKQKVRRLKSAIKVRAYENDLKLHVALERLRGEIEAGS